VSIDIPDTSFTIIVGPSGSGKTSMLRSIAGLERISDGQIFIGDRDVTDLAPKERDIAFVFQNYALYGHLTVRDNIGFPLRARKVPKREIAARVDDVAERLGLTPLLNRKPRALSGGQQQRVAIGRALVREPSVFLFDEPLSNLDAQLRLDMRREIIQLQRSLQVTSVWVTHDQEEAMAMGDQILVVNKGVVEQQDEPERLYMNPVNEYVASTIGSPPMNLAKGDIQGGRFTGEHFEVDVARDLPDGPVTLGVRPEDLYVAEVVDSDHSMAQLDAYVELIELLGPRAIVTLRVGETTLTGVFSRRELATLAEAETVRIAAPFNRLHFFSPEDGRRIEAPGAPPPTDVVPQEKGIHSH
jgi:multiple sugar transport system ATP-binding protein